MDWIIFQRVLYPLIVYVVLINQVTVIEIKEKIFYKVDQRNVEMTTYENNTAYNEVTCGLNCVESLVVCYSFIFNSGTNTCSLGTWLVPSMNILDYDPSVYTVGAFCDPGDNYVILNNGSESSCLRLSNNILNYTMASKACQANGAILYTMKQTAKYNMIVPFLKQLNHYAWVGLDDIDQEDAFRWVDDGSLLTQELRQLIFFPGEPNNFNSSEDCVSYFPDQAQFNDVMCSMSLYYVCEILPFEN